LDGRLLALTAICIVVFIAHPLNAAKIANEKKRSIGTRHAVLFRIVQIIPAMSSVVDAMRLFAIITENTSQIVRRSTARRAYPTMSVPSESVSVITQPSAKRATTKSVLNI
jgi:hypothetical protein